MSIISQNNSNEVALLDCIQRFFSKHHTKLEKILQERNISKEKLRFDIDIAPNTVAKIKKNEPMNLSVVDKICEYLQVQPGDILEWVSSENAKELEKREILSQIEALQKQLSEM